MPEARRTKRTRDPGDELTLDELIAQKRTEFVEARAEIPTIRSTADALREKARGMTCRYQMRLRRDTERHADVLAHEADVRVSMEREHAFERRVVTYLERYRKRVVPGNTMLPESASRQKDSIIAYVHHVDTVTQHRTSIVDEYLTEMEKAPAKVYMSVRDECPRCAERHTLLACTTRSIPSCPRCGYSVTYLDQTSTTTAFDETVEFSHYSYKRVNHYMMWLALVQGKETHRVPTDVITKVMHELYTHHNVRKKEDVTPQKVRESLRRLRLRSAYENVTQITSRISGRRPPQISVHVEEQLRNMFLQMQPAFQRHAPQSRTNFLSYSYVLYRCFQILGLTDMLDGLALLKGRQKLEANDAIFRKMCTDLGWPVFDLPP